MLFPALLSIMVSIDDNWYNCARGKDMVMLDFFVDIFIEAGTDTLKLVPFLFLTYVLMEWLEHRTGSRTQAAIRRAGKAGPLLGGVIGVFPQCGFSAAASNLYSGGLITRW